MTDSEAMSAVTLCCGPFGHFAVLTTLLAIACILAERLSTVVSDKFIFALIASTPPVCHILGRVADGLASTLTYPHLASGSFQTYSIRCSLLQSFLLVVFDKVGEKDRRVVSMVALPLAIMYTVSIHVLIVRVCGVNSANSRGPPASTADVVAKLLAKVPVVHLKRRLGDVLPASASTCVICLDDLTCGPCVANVLLLPCRHAFHKRCLDQWMRHDRSWCPVCRALLSRPAGWRLMIPSPAAEAQAFTSLVPHASPPLQAWGP